MAVAVRAQWKGTLQVGALAVPVSLFTAASTSDRTTFNLVSRDTGHRLRREFVDPTTEETVAKENQIKGFEVDPGQYLLFDAGEIEAAIPESNKKLAIEAFIPITEVDTLYFDKPYYLKPTGPGAESAFAVIRNALKRRGTVALAHAVLFRRYRAVLIRPSGKGMIAHTMNFDYEVRSVSAAFEEIDDVEIKGEMLDLAKHIIGGKMGTFDPATFADRYEAAVAELVKARIQGRQIEVPKPRAATNVVDLMEALRASAGVGKKQERAPRPRKADHSRKAS